MPRKRRIDKAKPHAEISAAMWAYLNDQAIPDGDSEAHFEIFMLGVADGEALRELWGHARGEVLAGWTKEHVGTRPSAWWKCEAPRQPMGNFQGAYYDGRLPEARRFISGGGCPAWLVLAYVPWYELGLPVQWVGYERGDPPVFESTASYLQRHNLLSPHELRMLTAGDYEQTQALPAECEVLNGDFDGPSADGVKFLRERDARIRARIPAARKSMGFFEASKGIQ